SDESERTADENKNTATPTLESVTGVAAAKPVPHRRYTRSRFGLAFRASSLGLGADFATQLTKHFNLRTGFNGFACSRTVSDSGLAYLGTLHLNSVQAIIDWFPRSHGIHFSPGLLLYNHNRVTAKALLPTGKTLSSGAETFISDPKDPITGAASSSMRKVAPMLLFGFGLIPRGR